MSDVDVRAVITAQDNASSVLAGVGGSFGQLAGAVALGEIAAQLAEKAFEALTDAVKDSIAEAMAAEDATALLGNAVESMGTKAGLSTETLEKNAMALEDHSKFSHLAIEGVEGVLVRMGDLSGPQVMAATKAIVDVGSATGDLSSAQNALARAMEHPEAAAMSLRRAHIYLTQSEQDAIKQAAAHNDIAGAQNLIIQAAENHYKNLGSEMSKTGSGPMEMFKNKMKDLQEVIGVPILNAINPWLEKLTNFVASDQFRHWLEDVSNGLKKFAEFATQMLKPAIDLLVAVFRDVVIPIFKTHKKQIEEVAVAIGILLVAAIGAAIVAIALIVGAIAGMIGIFTTVIGWVNAFDRSFWAAFTHITQVVGQTIEHMWDSASHGFNNFFSNAINWANNLMNSIVQVFLSLPGRIGGIIGGISSNALGDIKGALHSAHIPGFAGGVTNFSGGLALVGERGPEIVNLPQGSNVIPNNQISTSSNQAINITIQAGAFMGSKADARRLAEQVAIALKDVAGAKNQTAAQYLGA